MRRTGNRRQMAPVASTQYFFQFRVFLEMQGHLRKALFVRDGATNPCLVLDEQLLHQAHAVGSGSNARVFAHRFFGVFGFFSLSDRRYPAPAQTRVSVFQGTLYDLGRRKRVVIFFGSVRRNLRVLCFSAEGKLSHGSGIRNGQLLEVDAIIRYFTAFGAFAVSLSFRYDRVLGGLGRTVSRYFLAGYNETGSNRNP